MRPSARMRPHSFMSKTPPNKSRCMSSRYKRRIGLGAVSGVVMAFQFGTNWSALAKMSGPIQGPLLSSETFTAFALEPVFLASSFWADLRSSQPDLDPERLVFLDEMGAKTNMVRLYGRAPQRLFAPVPYGHWMTTTFAAALRHDEITVPCVFDGPISRSGLAARRFVVLDNLASHKVKGVRQLIEEAGALRYLPAYSPDLNPIEQAYASYHVAFPRHRRRPVFNGFTHTLGRVVSRPAPDARSLSAIASVAQPSLFFDGQAFEVTRDHGCQSKERGTSPVNSPAEVAQVVALACVVNFWKAG
jgi:Cytochrome bd terminal oxidase subunit I/DDE superfamily endonuclease